ncbi:hypothetical protein AXG89_30560 (plasmid) [Burkholderia sp. PAMC 26561]|nr:hypothetical protein AXG89_30560 [Burkholderia sp. PAMC 26561]
MSADNAQVQAVVEFYALLSQGALEILGAALAEWIRGEVGRQMHEGPGARQIKHRFDIAMTAMIEIQPIPLGQRIEVRAVWSKSTLGVFL